MMCELMESVWPLPSENTVGVMLLVGVVVMCCCDNTWRMLGPDRSVATDVLSQEGTVTCAFTSRVGGLVLVGLLPSFAFALRAMRVLR